MRVRVASALLFVATSASLVLIVILVTGGFVIEAGPLRLSAHRPLTPLLIAAGACVAAAQSRNLLAEMQAYLSRRIIGVARRSRYERKR